MKNLFIKSTFIVSFLVLLCSYASKAEGTGGKTGVPIDGGASALLAAGATYGLKKLRDSRKKNSDHDSAA